MAEVNITATSNRGEKYLNHREYKFEKIKNIHKHDLKYMELDFQIEEGYEDDFEVIIETFARIDLSIDYTILHKCD